MSATTVEPEPEKATLEEMVEEYGPALEDYLARGGEDALSLAYEFGRKAVEAGMGVVDVAVVHQHALAMVLLQPLPPEESVKIASAAEKFFTECLGAYEMIIRGFRETNEQLSHLNRTLERQVVERTDKLETAVRDLRKTMHATVRAISSMVEIRDPYTAGHARRVTRLACAIAKKMGLGEQHTEATRIAGLLHDIGKIAVPADILSKPAKLTEHEFAIIKEHPQVGYDILKEIQFPWPVADIVLQHHERMDGSGYPKGLHGNDICLEARVLGVSDVVEAISSHRPYRPALGTEKALQEISHNKGRLYDRPVAKACLAVFQEGSFTFDSDVTPP